MNYSSKEFYSTELFQQLKKSYDQRIEQVSRAFTLAIQRIEESEVLQEMKGDDLAEYRIQHIAEIAKQVVNNQQELNLEQYLRINSELKAQLAVQKMQMSFVNKRTPDKQKQKDKDSKKLKQLQDQIKYLKNQIDMRDAQQFNLQNLVDKQIKNKMKMIQQQYILKDQHQRIIQQKQRQFTRKSKKENREEKQQQAGRLIIQKYQQILEGQRKSSEQSMKALKQKYEYLMKDINRQNQTLKLKIDMLQSKLSVANQKLEEQKQLSKYKKQSQEKQQRKMQTPVQRKIINISENLSRINTQKSRALKDLKLYQDMEELQHFRSRVKKQIPYSYENKQSPITPTRYSKKNVQQPFQMQRLQSKRSSQHIQRVYENNYMLPRSPIAKGNVSPRWQDAGTKFDDIQNSFAKELAELRSKMSQKRQKPYSPQNRKNPYVREDSIAKRRLQQTTTQYSPKYTIKNYHHY